ncbi:SurA N-terminal domain-containing protein [Verrucomicrobiales bacterium BCK34]|nr:SurA N-terminal domain-containing protein [Verrucomicrobiales bacterium BCK34]
MIFSEKSSFRSRIVALTSITAVFLGLGAVAFAKPVVLNAIKAVVNGEPITQSMVDQAVQTQVRVWLMGNNGMVGRAEAEREIRKMEEQALDDLIDRNLILSEFKKLGGEIKDNFVDESVNQFITTRFGGDRDKFLAELKKSGMTIASFRDVQRDQIAIQALRSRHGGDQVIPNTPWEKKRIYNEIKGDFASAGQPKVRMLSIPKQTPTSSEAEQKAIMEKVKSSLKSGSSFSSVAKKYSDDSFASKGGYVGVLGKSGTLAQGLHDLAYQLPPGQMSPALDMGSHWRILYVEERVGKSVPSFEELEEKVDQKLTAEKRDKKLDVWLAKLRRDANVRIYE